MTGATNLVGTLRETRHPLLSSQPIDAKTKTSCYRLLLVDDHPLFRLGLRALLSRNSKIQVVAECGDAPSAVECLRLHAPDAVIMDITLPGGMDGLELIKNMKATQPSVSILVLSVHDENLYAFRALSAGARGYLMKDAATSNLEQALNTMRNGEIAVSPQVAQRLVRRAVEGRLAFQDPAAALSDRELEVLFRIGRGQSSCEIGSTLNISVKTVESHRANLRRKLSLKTGAELLRYAVAWRHAEGHPEQCLGSVQ